MQIINFSNSMHLLMLVRLPGVTLFTVEVVLSFMAPGVVVDRAVVQYALCVQEY